MWKINKNYAKLWYQTFRAEKINLRLSLNQWSCIRNVHKGRPFFWYFWRYLYGRSHTCWRRIVTSWRSVIARGRSVIAGFGSGSAVARSGGGSAITGFRSRSVIAWGLALIGVVGSIVLVVVVTMVSVMAMTIWLNVGSGRNQYQWYLKLQIKLKKVKYFHIIKKKSFGHKLYNCNSKCGIKSNEYQSSYWS